MMVFWLNSAAEHTEDFAKESENFNLKIQTIKL